MDFQAVVDGMSAMTCVVSVETLPDGKPGKFRIVTGNKVYIDSIEHPAPGAQMLSDKFVPNSEYTDYLTRDLNFEDYCYRSAVGRKCLHSYAHPDRMDLWLNMMFIPVGEPGENINYCLYMMEMSFEADPEQMTFMSGDTSSSVLDICIRLRGTNDFKATMKEVIKGIRDLCDSEHCCILVLNEAKRSCYVLGEAFAPGSPLLPMEHYINDEFYDIVESWAPTIAGSNCLIAKDDQGMEYVREKNPVWYGSLTAAGAHNVALFPLKSRNELMGYMWALNFNPALAGKIKDTLEVTTFILGSELGNHLLLDRLRNLSSKDLLTGVMNRNEMNNFVDSLCNSSEAEKKSVGVIFSDLNGLKAVNDIEGHNAGDILLKNAASALREVFEEKSVFRAGGDEFAVIVTDIDEKGLEEKIAEIRKVSEKYRNVIFAIGGAVEEDSRNVRMALRRADERMYEDKRIFYEQNPERAGENRAGHSGSDEVEEKFRERSIFRDMNFDHLTGLASMTYFFKLAEDGRRRMHEAGTDSVVLFVNLSGMKFFNQKNGFAEGDVLIKGLAGILSDEFGEENCSRFGQDHFAVFTGAEGIEDKLKKVFREVKHLNNGNSLPVRAGIYPDSMGLVEATLACDRAKYACNVKRDDYSSYYNFFDSKMLSRELSRQYILDNLDRAIAENWVKAFYQPIVRSTNRKVCDEEALARWIDPVKGMLSPADFIPILEDTKLIYKVDLHICDLILERIKKQLAAGKKVVPISINLSRTDFEVCDIVAEIDNRFKAAGVSKDLVTIEITESVVGENFEFMKEQIERFQSMGYKVWMDDFGSGYSSLELLQEMHFDLIKFDMRFMRRFDATPRSRILLTELMRMAQSLDVETVCEGVETEEQADFLTEVGCTRLQGYYFCKPIPEEEIWERHRKGIQIGFENTDESGYYKTLGEINMYDLSSIYNGESTERQYFDIIPMAVLEFGAEGLQIIRGNKSYNDFLERYIMNEEAEDDEDGKAVDELTSAIRSCHEVGSRVFMDERLYDGSTMHAMIKKIADNPVRNVAAYVIAILDIKQNKDELTYADIAKALSADYIDIYHVDMETEQFVQYSPDGSGLGVSAERHGENFFTEAGKDAQVYVYEADREQFAKLFNKENVIRSLKENGVFVHTYRLKTENEPVYVNMKVVPMKNDPRHFVMAVNNVDGQMKQQEIIERLREEKTVYSRISALMGDFIAIYTVDPENGSYMQYSAADNFSDLGTSKLGLDFFGDSRKEISMVICPEDLDYFKSAFTKEKVLKRTEKGQIFKIRYRLMIGGEPVKVTLRAGMTGENDGAQLIVGVGFSSEEA